MGSTAHIYSVKHFLFLCVCATGINIYTHTNQSDPSSLSSTVDLFLLLSLVFLCAVNRPGFSLAMFYLWTIKVLMFLMLHVLFGMHKSSTKPSLTEHRLVPFLSINECV